MARADTTARQPADPAAASPGMQPQRLVQGRDPDILTTEELAHRWGVTPQTIRALAANGEIPGLRVGKNWRYSYPAVHYALTHYGQPQALQVYAIPAAGRGDTDVLSTEDLAERLGVTTKTIRSLVARGVIPALRIGRNWRYSYRAALHALTQAGRPPKDASGRRPTQAPAGRCPTCGQPVPADLHL